MILDALQLRLLEKIRSDLAGYSVVRSTSPLDNRAIWLEIFAGAIHKGNSCQTLLKKLNINCKEVAGLGNDYNDIDFLDICAEAYLVANAPVNLQRHYKLVRSDKEEGFTEKYINKNQKNGLIITGKSGTGKTHLATAILNKLTEKYMQVLMGRLILLLDVIKDTFKDFSSKEKDIIELYSKVDMLIIDDLGTERISSWALEKLYTIIENRNENKLPIIVTTRFNKGSLLDRFYQSEDEELAEAVIEKLYQFCYGIELKKYNEYEKEKVSISD